MTKSEPRRRLSTVCECQDPSHQMEFILADWDEDDVELYVEVQLNQLHGFLKRCWLALWYVMGRRSRYGFGHWDAGSISPESARELLPMLTEFIAIRQREENRRQGAQSKPEEISGG